MKRTFQRFLPSQKPSITWPVPLGASKEIVTTVSAVADSVAARVLSHRPTDLPDQGLGQSERRLKGPSLGQNQYKLSWCVAPFFTRNTAASMAGF